MDEVSEHKRNRMPAALDWFGTLGEGRPGTMMVAATLTNQSYG